MSKFQKNLRGLIFASAKNEYFGISTINQNEEYQVKVPLGKGFPTKTCLL